MTLAELEKNIINLAKGGGIPSDDSRLNGRLVKYWIRYYRSALIPEFTDFGKLIYPELVQDLGNVQLTKVDKAESPDKSVVWNENIGKTTLPPLVDLPFNRGLTFVGLSDKQTPINITTSDAIHWTRYRRFTSGDPRAYMIGNDLYVESLNNKRLKYINIRGVFEDPTEIEGTDAQGNKICFDNKNDPYPIPSTMINKLVVSILSTELNTILKTPYDISNDALDTTGQFRPAPARR